MSNTVVGYTPTSEQQAILDEAVKHGLEVLVIPAGAGAGKTSTLKMLEQTVPGLGQYTAFNAPLVTESKTKFSKCAVNTTHSLAFRAVGHKYSHRLNSNRMKSEEIARRLGIVDMQLVIAEATSTEPAKLKILSAGFLAGQAIQAVRRFCQSADHEITQKHFKYIDGIDMPLDGKRTYFNNDTVKEYLLPFAIKAWEDFNDPNGQLPYAHDYYIKTWQLGTGQDKPLISADYIMVDEAQDLSPVFLDILKQQTHALLICVGDSNQAIYEWRGAIDAMKAFPNAPRRQLSQSFRFGQAIADVANSILDTLEEPTDLIMRGLESIPSIVAPLDKPRCILCRTNAGAVGTVLRHHKDGGKPHLIGGGVDTVRWVKAAQDLQAGRHTTHPELACFDKWSDVQEYSKQDEGEDLRLMVKLVDEFTCEAILEALDKMPKEENADLVVSTAHKSKGREWNSVKLAGDFRTANKLDDAERRLVYVAATRAKYQLDVSQCPTFCGGKDKQSENGEFIPGIKITYTQAMPTAEQLAKYIANKDKSANVPNVPNVQIPTTSTNQPIANGKYTWSKWDGGWFVRGKPNQEGKDVIVSRKNGTTSKQRLGTAVQRFADTWLYRVC